eukprot:Gb_33485 [translate_table: standard]
MMDSEQGKVFIGGISWETTEETLREYFKVYGEVVQTVIMRDRMTGRARGFGFIGFADPSVVDRVLQDKHSIDGRQVELKRAVPRDEQQKGVQKGNIGVGGGPRTKKIFVGGLAPTVTEEDFRRYFEQFGNITDVVVMYDHISQRPRGFGFITFDSEEAVDKVVMKNFHELHDKMVEVKRALPKEMSPGSVRGRSSPMGAFGGRPDSRYGAPPAGRGGYPPYGAVPGYFAGGYAPGVNGAGYGPAAPAAPGYGATPAGYAGGAYGGGYANPPYGAGAAPYVSAPMGGGYAAGAAGGPWGSGIPTAQTAGVNAGYSYGSADTGYGGGYGATPTGAYVAPPAGGSGSYPGNTGDMYGSSGYGDTYNPPPGGSVGVSQSSGYGMGGPVQTDSGLNGSSGYGAAGRQTQRVPDARFRPYPTSADRAS